MRLPVKSVLLSLFLLLLSLAGSAQEVAFRAIPLQTTVGVGRSFQVTYNLDNAGPVSDIQLLPQSDFSVTPGYADASRTSTQIVNGNAKTTQTYSRTYTFQAKKEGAATLPIAVATSASGNTYRTQPVKMQVVGRNNAPAQQRPIDPFSGDPFGNAFGGPDPFAGANGRNPFEDMERMIQRQTMPTAQQARERAKMFVSLSNPTVWMGEPVRIKYVVRTSVNLQPTGDTRLPSAEGLWIEPVVEAPRSAEENVVYQVIAIPQRSGVLTIPPAEIGVRANVMGAGGYAERYDFALTSPAQTLNVRPLPQPQPGAFLGAVGDFEMASELPDDTLDAGGGTVLRIRISGSGGLSQLEAPKLNLPEGLFAGEPRVKDQISQTGNTLTGWREFQYTISAEEGGNFTIPPVSFSFFNPQTETYQTLESPQYTLRVNAALKNADRAEISGETQSPLTWITGILVLAGLVVSGLVLRLIFRQKKQEPEGAAVPAPSIIVSPEVSKSAPIGALPVETPITTLQEAVSRLRSLKTQLSAGSSLAPEITAFLSTAEGFLYGGGAGTEAMLFPEAMALIGRAENELRTWISTP